MSDDVNNGQGKVKKSKHTHRLTVSLTDEVYDFITETAKENETTRSHIFRIMLEDNLASYLGVVRYYDEEQSKQVSGAVNRWADNLEKIRMELNRIGVNYNQALKIENLRRKIEENNRKDKEGKSSFDEMLWRRYENETYMDEISALEEMSLGVENISPALEEFYKAAHESGALIRKVLYGK